MLVRDKVASIANKTANVNNKQKDQEKMLDEQRRKISELYIPPGVVKIDKVFDKEVKKMEEVRLTIP